MVLHMCKKCNKNHPDSLDWIVLGIFHRFYLSEWEQNASDKRQPLVGTDDLLLAFISPDLIFAGTD